MRPHRPLLLLLTLIPVLALGWAGCSRGPLVREAPDLERPADFPHHSAAQIVLLMEQVAERDSLRAFTSQTALEVRSPGRNADATAALRAADTLWASVRGPFGIEAARALVTGDSVYVHDKLKNRLYLGPLTAAAAYLPGPVGPADLFATLTGTLRPRSGPGWVVEADSQYYRLDSPDETFVVDPATWRAVRYERRAGGAVVDRRTFSAFDVVEGRVLPRRVGLESPPAGVSVRPEHERLAPNPGPLDYPFRPGSAERRTLN
ncbi:MAG: DUF4292 domain-containing protein [Rhodothermales bacterium]|nr:DUF4292 domain-containing protein [Rhodothermales bacterium]